MYLPLEPLNLEETATGGEILHFVNGTAGHELCITLKAAAALDCEDEVDSLPILKGNKGTLQTS